MAVADSSKAATPYTQADGAMGSSTPANTGPTPAPRSRQTDRVASAWMLYEMKSRDLCPVAIAFNTVNPILAQGAAHAGITMLAGFEGDITQWVRHGARLRLDPARRTPEVLG